MNSSEPTKPSNEDTLAKYLVKELFSLKFLWSLIAGILAVNVVLSAVKNLTGMSQVIENLLIGFLSAIFSGFAGKSIILMRNIYNHFAKPGITFSMTSKLLLVTKFIYSSKSQGGIFEPIASDWQQEYFEALFKKEIWKARWINVRYTYAFLATMWQKSPIGDLIEFVSKLAK